MAASGTPYGQRLLPVAVDELAKNAPQTVYGSIPRTADVKDGFLDVSMADMARCVNFMARWIEDKFGRSDSFETLTYIGLSDLRGPATLYASTKAGYKLLLVSPRNPPATNLSLINRTQSTKVLYTAELAPLMRPLQALAPTLRIEAVPSFQEMLNSTPEHYPYQKSFREARDDPLLVLHSSGSTGLPRPITYTHGSVAAYDLEHTLPAPDGRRKKDVACLGSRGGETRVYGIFPFFHTGGFISMAYHAVLNGVTVVLGPPHLPPDGLLLEEIARQQDLRGIAVVPSMIEEVLKKPGGIDLFKKLDFVLCGGAPLPQAVGDRLAQIDTLSMMEFYGSTETFPIPQLFKSPSDWIYHEFNPNFKHEMQPYDTNEGTFELVLFPDETTALYHTVPGECPYYTKDLFTRHPDPAKHNLYRYYGRRDDIVVLSNGEKFNPIPFEQHTQADPSVKGVLVIGNQRNQPALLVEPREPLPDESSREAFIEALWPRIDQSNAYIPGQGRVSRDKVICVTPDKTLVWTPKGTIVRRLSEEAYKNEIESLYLGSVSQDQVVTVSLEGTTKTVYEPARVTSFLRQVLSTSFAPAKSIGEDEDFFAYGLDSVQTLEIVANLRRNLQGKASKPTTWISPRTIFYNSTLAELSGVLTAFLNDEILPEANYQRDGIRPMDDAVARYVEGLPDEPASRPAASTKTSAVAIIGSTGYLGTYVVAELLRNPDITRIYCLNRSANAQERQEAALGRLDSEGVLSPLLAKLVYLPVELGRPRLGLGPEEYDLLTHEVDVIVYNAWRLDFGLALRSFDSFLRATRDTADLALAAAAAGRSPARIVFVSSVAAVEGLPVGTMVPEAPVDNASAAVPTGYGRSKLTAERILAAAGRRADIPVSIVRVCQVGGPSTGAGVWADQPWLSAVARTSSPLGCIPSLDAPIDWVPVDTVAAMLREFILRPAQQEIQVYNISANKPQPWQMYVDVLCEMLGISEVVPMRDWVKKLRNITDPTPADVDKFPALRLLDFYETLGNAAGSEGERYATDHALSVSKVDIPPLEKELLASWLRTWDL